MYLYLQGGGRDFNSVRMPTTDALVHLLSRSLRLRTHLPSLSAPPHLPAQPSSTHSAAAGGGKRALVCNNCCNTCNTCNKYCNKCNNFINFCNNFACVFCN